MRNWKIDNKNIVKGYIEKYMILVCGGASDSMDFKLNQILRKTQKI